MKHGLAITWEGPGNDSSDAHYVDAMVAFMTRELESINKRFEKHGMKRLEFTISTSEQTKGHRTATIVM